MIPLDVPAYSALYDPIVWVFIVAVAVIIVAAVVGVVFLVTRRKKGK